MRAIRRENECLRSLPTGTVRARGRIVVRVQTNRFTIGPSVKSCPVSPRNRAIRARLAIFGLELTLLSTAPFALKLSKSAAITVLSENPVLARFVGARRDARDTCKDD